MEVDPLLQRFFIQGFIGGFTVDGELQLVGGQDEREGRVEMFYKGEWGTVCGDLWKDSQTVIVCKQLNFYEEGQSKPLYIVEYI